MIRIMLDELAKADRLEQMNQNRRRMKLQKHKKKVEELWNLKKQKIVEEQQRRDEERRQERSRQLEEEALIEAQKQLLVQKHMPYIEGFCSKDLVDLARNGAPEKSRPKGKQFENYIFGVSGKQIQDWERQKENRRTNY